MESDPEEPTRQPVEQANVCSFAFDHIYAITPDNVGGRGRTLLLSDSQQCEIRSNQLIAQQAQLEVGTLRVTLDGSKTEVQKLKSLISAHLDLIQKQSEIITLNERTIKKYAAENEQVSLHSVYQQPPLFSDACRSSQMNVINLVWQAVHKI